ncbi:unnamed protein product, partial [Closterium sp. NIES-64]
MSVGTPRTANGGERKGLSGLFQVGRSPAHTRTSSAVGTGPGAVMGLLRRVATAVATTGSDLRQSAHTEGEGRRRVEEREGGRGGGGGRGGKGGERRVEESWAVECRAGERRQLVAAAAASSAAANARASASASAISRVDLAPSALSCTSFFPFVCPSSSACSFPSSTVTRYSPCSALCAPYYAPATFPGVPTARDSMAMGVAMGCGYGVAMGVAMGLGMPCRHPRCGGRAQLDEWMSFPRSDKDVGVGVACEVPRSLQATPHWCRGWRRQRQQWEAAEAAVVAEGAEAAEVAEEAEVEEAAEAAAAVVER